MIKNIKDTPQAYSFFQAIRLLERAADFERGSGLGRRLVGTQKSIGAFTPPSQEVIRLRANPSLRFPEAEIHSLIQSGEPGSNKAWTLAVTFMGLTGSMGVMPFHYTELILQRIKLKDETLAHFLDLFNHRSLSLFYRAATKYRLPLAYEKSHVPGSALKTRDMHSQALLSLIGLGTKGLENRLEIKDESLIFYSGLLAQQVRTSSGLKQILEDYFEIPVTISEFLGQWGDLIPDSRSQLSSRGSPKGQNAQLGVSVIFGKKGWFSQGKIRIGLGPLNREQFHTFAPGTRTLQALNQMVRFYLGPEQDYDFVIEVDRQDIPDKISLNKKTKPLMGWNTWLSGGGKTKQQRGETLTINVSANRLS